MSIEKLTDAISIRYNNKVYELRERGLNPIVMSLGEAYFSMDSIPLDIQSNPKIFHYTHSRGTKELRNILSKFYNSNYKSNVDGNKNIIISAGSKILTYMALKALIENSSDEVLIPEPAWVSYSEQAKLCNANVRYIPINTEIDNYENFIGPNTKVLIICNPHNPSGKNISAESIERLYNLAKEKNFYILADEAYSEFVPAFDKFTSFANIDKNLTNTIVVNSISKNLGLSGWRIGFALACEKNIEKLYKLNQHLITCAPSLLEFYTADNFNPLLENARVHISELLRKRIAVAEMLDAASITHLEGNSTFYFFLKLDNWTSSSVEFADKLLNDYNVAVVPGIGYGPGCDNYVRISIGSESLDRLNLGIECIKTLLNK